jgi:hypothetical protein
VVTDEGVDQRDAVCLGRFRLVVADDEDAMDVRRSLELVRDGKGRIAAPFLKPGSYRFHVAAEGYTAQRVGVRARSAEAEAPLRAIPDLPQDWATPVHLEPAAGDGAADGEGD